MLRILSFAAAIAAVLVIPFTQADARPGGMSSGGRMGSFSGARGFSSGPRSFSSGPRSFSSGPRSFSSGPRSFSSGPRSFSNVRSFSTIRSVNRINAGRRVAFIGPRFRHRRFFGGFGFYSAGLYGSCWSWVPTVYGLRRVWVCDPYYSSYYY
jgi:hypothetical protein